MKLITFTLAALASLLLFSKAAFADDAPERVYYLSGIHTLDGHLYKPAGKGPFPVVVFNQSLLNSAMPANEKPFQTLAHMFTSKGWAFFVPGRHSLGPTMEKNKGATPDERMVHAHEKQGANIAAAVSWLKKESYIDTRRVVVMGEAAGGVSSLFAIEHGMEASAIVLFAPGVQSMRNELIKDHVRAGVSQAKCPIFLIQTESDNSLRPSDVIGIEMEKKGGLDRFKIYPSYGNSPSDAAKFPSEGYAIWEADFFGFAGEVFESSVVAQKSSN